LRRLHIGNGEALAEVTLEEQFLADLSSYLIHPALLDVATGAAFYLTEDYEHSNDLFLPIAYKRMRLYHSLPARFFSHIRARLPNGSRKEVETFDITLFDADGKVLAEIERFSARRMANLPTALSADDSAGMISGSSGEQLIETGERAGIDPQTGAREFVRILSDRTPRSVIAVSEPLGELQTDEARPGHPTGPEQPALASPDAAAAGDAVEETLARWWREMLGVARAGLDDDFFDLGGHSLIAVRLFAKVRKTFGVDLDFVVLFEARSIRKLADLIRRAQPQQEGV